MEFAAFKEYLLTDYVGQKSGRPLQKRPVADALSRGKRIERVLKIELGSILNGQDANLQSFLHLLEARKYLFEINGNTKNGMASIKNAAKLYCCFLAHRNRSLPD